MASISLPEGMTSIGEGTFYGCRNLTVISIPTGVTSIYDATFSGCSGLISMNIPETVTSIGNSAFEYCSGLTAITIPKSVTSIGDFTFRGCSGLISVTIPEGMTSSIGNYTFCDCSSLTSVTLPEGVTSIGDYAFAWCKNITSLTIPKSVLSIGNDSFYGCIGLTYIIIPDGVASIGDYAFFGCRGLTTMSIPNSVTSIGEYAFRSCGNITSLVLPQNIKNIKKGSFQECSSLTSVTIPISVEYIYQEAFSGCTSLKEINAQPTTPPFLFYDSFSDYSVSLKVPSGCVAAYRNADNWKNFTTISDGSKYKLKYVINGEEYITYEFEYGEVITPEPAPTKEGYTFSGWSDIPQTMPAHDVTVTGTFTVNKYKMTYIVDGSEYKSYNIEYGANITPETAPTKEGYTFSGWSEIPATMPARDVTVTGTFTANIYQLTYMVDGEVYKTYDIEYGATITPEAAPTKEGYVFSGWSEIPTTMPANDVTVTGTFSKGSYKLTYMVDGEVYKTVNYDYGATITPEAEPTKEGYTFSGWSEIPSTMPAKDVTVTGSFIINKYKLTYMVDGEEYKSYDVEYGAKITPEAEPTKEGYTFSGWSSIPETMPAKDVTVTGMFTKGAYKLTYMVDGAIYKTVTYDYGATITPEAEPTKEGYTFSGWSEIPSTMPANDVTVYGTFTVNKYILTYMVDNEVYRSYDVEYGATITPEEAPTKENYIFSGWSEIPETMPAHDVTVTGTFTYAPPKAYTLTYMVDGEVYKTVSYYEGEAITPEAEPTKEGYTFSGWSYIPSTMPAEDVTVYGTFTVNKYTLTYMVDGEVYKTYKIEYGATITPEPAPSKEGYNFSGWDNVPETMPAHDVIVYGSLTVGITDIFINFEEVKIFDTKGNQIGRLKKGINILMYKNGERKKVIIQ